jgi:diguanylate cyclase (GGDEF)-like protein
MDIDYFKQYNDTYGHQMGDNVLVQVATTLKNSLNRADDYCFRLGGEEFGILFEADSKAQSIEFTDLIRKNIENLHIPHSASSVGPHITVSIGLICEEANSVLDADMVYKQVDDLLYEAKRGGRNCVVVGD